MQREVQLLFQRKRMEPMLLETNSNACDIRMMERALAQARRAGAAGEVPVGAVIVGADAVILAEAGNNCIGGSDPSGHAEMAAIRAAARSLYNYRLPGVTVYVTLEPCAMCAALMVHARVARLVFGAADPKAGAVVSKYRIGSDGLLNHGFVVSGGVLAEECSRLLRDFFRSRR